MLLLAAARSYSRRYALRNVYIQTAACQGIKWCGWRTLPCHGGPGEPILESVWFREISEILAQHLIGIVCMHRSVVPAADGFVKKRKTVTVAPGGYISR